MRNALTFFLMAALVIDTALIVFAATRRDRANAIHFTALAAALFIYTLGYLAEIYGATVEGMMTAIRIENLGIALVSPFFLLMAMSLFHEKKLKDWMMPSAFAYGFLVFLTVLTNDSHHLFYKSIELKTIKGFTFAALQYGSLFWIQQIVSLCLVVTANILVLSKLFAVPKKTRVLIASMIATSSVAFAVNLFNVFVSPRVGMSIDILPMVLTVVFSIFSIYLFRSKQMDIVAIASNAAIESMNDAMIVLDNRWRYLLGNTRAKELIPSLRKCSGLEAVSHMRDWPAELSARKDSGMTTFSIPHPATGDELTFRANISKIINPKERQIGWSIVLRDITDLTNLMRRMEELATIDSLTGIYNRRQFLQMVERELDMALRHNLTMALIMYDLDWFKKINDTHGHLAGDHVLRSVADTVKNQLRSYDIFARYGGEEFVIFTMSGEGKNLKAFVKRLCEAVEDTRIVYCGTHIPVTASFGVVMIPPGTSFENSMKACDMAMYEAKNRGRNQVVMGKVVDKRLEI